MLIKESSDDYTINDGYLDHSNCFILDLYYISISGYCILLISHSFIKQSYPPVK